MGYNVKSDALSSIILSFLDNKIDEYSQSQILQINKIISDYLINKVNYNDAKLEIRRIVGTDAPIIKIKEVMSVSNQPLPSNYSTIDPNSRQKTRPWTKYEDQRLLSGILKFGTDSWSLISQFVGNNRSRSQCSQRWIRGLNPHISKGLWTIDEDNRLLHLIHMYGEKSWTRVSNEMQNRSDVQCRYRYRQLIGNNNSRSDNSSENSNLLYIHHTSKSSSSPDLSREDESYSVHSSKTCKLSKNSLSQDYRRTDMYSPFFSFQMPKTDPSWFKEE